MILKAIPLCALGWLAVMTAQDVRADEWNKHWSTGAKPELRIHAGDASVVIQSGESNGVTAHLTTRGWSVGRDGVQISEHQTGDVVDLDIRTPRQMFNMGSRSIQIEIRVPRDLTGDVHTGDGSIKLLGLRGTLRVNTGDGSIRGEDLEGSLEGHTGDGSMHVTGRFDNVQLHTQDGSMEFEARAGSHLQSSWHMETGDGSVRVVLPSSLKADLDLRTGDGRIQVDFPGLAADAKTDHQTRGKLNGGGPTLLVKTGDGSITVAGR